MIDTTRYRPLITVFGAVLAVLVVFDVGLRLAVGISPEVLLRASFHNKRIRDIVAGRVSGVIADRAHETAPRPLAVIVGPSSALEGLRTKDLNAIDREHRWLNLAMAGSSFDEVAYNAAPLFDSGLRADLVVLGIHLGWFVGRVSGDPELDEVMIASPAPRTSWLMFNRGRLNHLVRLELARVRQRSLPALGVELADLYPPPPEPWVEPSLGTMMSVSSARDHLELWRRMRWFDAAWYDQADVEIAARLIADCQRIGKRIVIVLMPESTALRTAIPRTAEAALARALARLPAPPQVIDLRAAIPDAGFGDYIHLDETGARQLSEVLIPYLR